MNINMYVKSIASNTSSPEFLYNAQNKDENARKNSDIASTLRENHAFNAATH